MRDPEDSLHSESLMKQENWEFLGKIHSPEISQKIAKGEIHPTSLKEIIIENKIKGAIEKITKIVMRK